MKIEAILTPAELPALAKRDLRETLCVVFDVLRATSTFVTALHNGAKAIIPVSEIAEALAFKKAESEAGNVLLGGERDGVKIRAAQTGGTDFDLGNSPREYTPEKVRGKTIVSTTTNGTRALRACAGREDGFGRLIFESRRDGGIHQTASACGSAARLRRHAGKQGDEDVLAAGALCEILDAVGRAPVTRHRSERRERVRSTREFSDSAEIARRAYAQAKSDLAAAVSNSTNARRLLAIPELRDDVAFCLQRDIFPLIARMEADGAIRRQPA